MIMNESYGSVNSHGLWACANTNNPYKVGDGSMFIPDFPRFAMNDDVHVLIKDEVLLTVSCPIFPFILIAKNLFTGSLKNRSIDNLETQKKSISMKNSQFFDYLLYAKSK